MDDPNLPGELMKQIHDDLTRTHRWLGNTAAILKAIKYDPLPIQRVLDVGCGGGKLLSEIRRRFHVDVIGVDLRPPSNQAAPVPILQADAVRDRLPKSDIAVSVCLAHHLSEAELVDLIRNVGRSCRRLVLLDLVRHWLPLVLFRAVIGPWVSPMNATDGCRSIRRSYTPAELRSLVRKALAGSEASFRHSVAPLYMRQIVDISYSGRT
jgi:SAM-dependent methyltransferase